MAGDSHTSRNSRLSWKAATSERELLDGLGGVQLGVGNHIGQSAGVTAGNGCHY